MQVLLKTCDCPGVKRTQWGGWPKSLELEKIRWKWGQCLVLPCKKQCTPKIMAKKTWKWGCKILTLAFGSASSYRSLLINPISFLSGFTRPAFLRRLGGATTYLAQHTPSGAQHNRGARARAVHVQSGVDHAGRNGRGGHQAVDPCLSSELTLYIIASKRII